MKKFNEAMQNPSGLDSRANYMGADFDDSLLCLMAITRDSDILSESNWEVALKELGGESDSVQIIRIGHWACGWIDYLCIVEGSEQETIGDDIERCLADYPVLDDDDFSEREQDAAHRAWADNFSIEDRVRYIRDNEDQFHFYSLSEMVSCVRGDYFAGHASELIY